MSVGASGVGVRRGEGKAFISKEQHVQKLLRAFYRNWKLGERSRILGRNESEVGRLQGTIF